MSRLFWTIVVIVIFVACIHPDWIMVPLVDNRVLPFTPNWNLAK